MYHILKPSRSANAAGRVGEMNLSYITTCNTLKEAREKIRDKHWVIWVFNKETGIGELI